MKQLLTSRERVLRTLDHQEPDRVPIAIGSNTTSTLHMEAYFAFKKHLGIELSEVEKNLTLYDAHWGMPFIDDQILKMFHADLKHIGMKDPPPVKQADGTLKDEWGIRWRQRGHFFWVEEPPLAKITEVSQVEDYPWPDVTIDRLQGLEKRAKQLEDEGWALMTSPGEFNRGLLHIMVFMRGEKQFYMDMYKNPKLLDTMMNKIMDLEVEVYGQLLDAVGDRVQLVHNADDWGTQTGLFISPSMFRRFFYPHYRRLHDLIHRKSQAKVFLHSCGAIEPLINDLIDAGVDVLDPIQPLAKGMDSEVLKKKYGDRIVFHGGIDTQKVLPYGSVEDVRHEALIRIKALGPGGGYISTTSHCIQPGVPMENVVALYDALYEYGKYPIGQ